jgi:multidrug efflux system membrane fusion protein
MRFRPHHQTSARQGIDESRWRWWVWLPVVAALGFGGMRLLDSVLSAAPLAGKKKPSATGPPPVPVGAVEATSGNVDIYLSGLGSVVPLNTVTVRSRVDGQLDDVFFEEGQLVEKGALLAQIDPRPFQAQLQLARGQLAHDLALLANARLDRNRYAALAKKDSIARQQYDTQRSLVRQLEGTVKTDRANVANARLQLSYSRIASPIAGRVGLRLVDPGNIVHATDTTGIVTLAQVQPMSVVFSIAEDSLPPVMEKLRAGESLRVDAFDRSFSRLIASGKLLTADNQIDQATGTVRLKALFDNADLALFPGQFVNARLLLDTEQGKTLVPTAAVQRGAQATFVYVVKPDQTADVRDVRTGPASGEEVAIEEGLKPGELVVVDGADRLRQGSKVQLLQGGSGASGGSR